MFGLRYENIGHDGWKVFLSDRGDDWVIVTGDSMMEAQDKVFHAVLDHRKAMMAHYDERGVLIPPVAA